jgi:sugar lactone lactonase YvrE
MRRLEVARRSLLRCDSSPGPLSRRGSGDTSRPWSGSFLLGCLLVALLPLAPAPGAAAQENTIGAQGPSTLVYPPYRHTYGIHRARTSHLKLFLGGGTVFADPQGLAAVKLARDDDPKLKGDDFQLTVFGLNSGRGEIIFNSSMQTLAMYGTHGSGKGQFDSPRGVAADVNGNVYVADTGNRRVAHLALRDRQLKWVGLLPGSYREPWGVATAPQGEEVYVSDRLANQVYRWRPAAAEGEPVAALPEGIDRPTAIAVLDGDELWLSGKEDALFVIFEDGARLAKFDRSGKLLAVTTAAERDSVRAAPRFGYLAADFYGNVYVTDSRNGTIYKFKRDLTFLTSYGEFGEGEYQLNDPRGIAIWKRFGQVFVAEQEGAQYFFVGTDVLLPEGPLAVRVQRGGGEDESVAGAGGTDADAGETAGAEASGADAGETTGADVRYSFGAFFTERTELALTFLSASGAVVDSLALPEPLDSGAVTVAFDGTQLAHDLPERATRIVLEPRPTYSSRKRFARRMEREIDWQLSP